MPPPLHSPSAVCQLLSGLHTYPECSHSKYSSTIISSLEISLTLEFSVVFQRHASLTTFPKLYSNFAGLVSSSSRPATTSWKAENRLPYHTRVPPSAQHGLSAQSRVGSCNKTLTLLSRMHAVWKVRVSLQTQGISRNFLRFLKIQLIFF